MCTVQSKQLDCQCNTTDFDWNNPNVCREWCVIMYDHFYAGIILATDESYLQVKCMSSAGPNKYLQPLRGDNLWYSYEDVLAQIDLQNPVTSRQVEVKKDE